jgi:hypothetical protein
LGVKLAKEIRKRIERKLNPYFAVEMAGYFNVAFDFVVLKTVF